MTWVGIDQSYTGFGLAIMDEKGCHTYLGTWPAAKFGEGAYRLLCIQEWLTDHLIDLPINMVCMEGYSNGSKFGREKAGELGAAVKLALYDLPPAVTPVIIVPPLSVKKFATGSGAAKKSAMLLAVYKRWGVEFTDDNHADAFVLAQIAKAIDTQDTNLTKFQQDVISKLV